MDTRLSPVSLRCRCAAGVMIGCVGQRAEQPVANDPFVKRDLIESRSRKEWILD